MAHVWLLINLRDGQDIWQQKREECHNMLWLQCPVSLQECATVGEFCTNDDTMFLHVLTLSLM